MNGARACGCIAIVLLTACDPAPPPAADAADAARTPLVVYAAPQAEEGLAPALAAYTAATGVPVEARYAAALPEVLGEGRDDPRADLAVFVGSAAVATAVEEGVLRPVARDVAVDVLPSLLRDPDGTWLAVAWRPAVIARDVRHPELAAIDDYGALAGSGNPGRLCLTSFYTGANAAVVADLIDALGVEPAERVVRGWLANAALPALATEADLLAAIGSGKCAAGVVLAPVNPPPDTGVIRYRTPREPSGQLWAAGVSRHAARPEGARSLLAWLVTEAELPAAARRAAAGDLPARHPAHTGSLGDAAERLAERAGYR